MQSTIVIILIVLLFGLLAYQSINYVEKNSLGTFSTGIKYIFYVLSGLATIFFVVAILLPVKLSGYDLMIKLLVATILIYIALILTYMLIISITIFQKWKKRGY